METIIEVETHGKPVLRGRKLDVRHVIWGITVFDPESIFTYQNQFGVSIQQIRHAVLYCKDEMCVKQEVHKACTGCGKRINTSRVEDDPQDQDCSEVAQNVYLRLKKTLSLPDSYDALFLSGD